MESKRRRVKDARLSSVRARILKPSPSMLLFLAVATTVLASPPSPGLASQLPKGAVLQVTEGTDGVSGPTIRGQSAGRDPDADDLLGGVLAQLAVVKPHRSVGDGPPSLQLFVLIAPFNGQIGIRAFGSF